MSLKPSSDPIADLLTRIRNALAVRKEQTTVPVSKIKLECLRVLKEQGYITDYAVAASEEVRGMSIASISLKYEDEAATKPVISGVRRVSRPGRRRYVPADSIPKVMGGLGTTIVSTSQGVMTGHQARQRGIGGEVLAEVW